LKPRGTLPPIFQFSIFNFQFFRRKTNGGNARDHQPSVHRVQASELHDDEEQEDHDREAGAEEILPARSEADRSSGNQVAPNRRELNGEAWPSRLFAATAGQ
jgi:hypothetical protein